MADLTTVTKVRDYLGLTTLEADAILATLVTSSSAWVEAQLNRTFGSAQVTETRNGDGTTRMILNQSPATAVTSVTVDGTAIAVRATVSGTGHVLSDNGIDLVGYTFNVGIQNVVFVYTAGVAVPSPVEQAVIEHVAFKYRRRTSLGQGTASVAGESVTYADTAVLAGIEDLLSPYRVLVVG